MVIVLAWAALMIVRAGIAPGMAGIRLVRDTAIRAADVHAAARRIRADLAFVAATGIGLVANGAAIGLLAELFLCQLFLLVLFLGFRAVTAEQRGEEGAGRQSNEASGGIAPRRRCHEDAAQAKETVGIHDYLLAS